MVNKEKVINFRTEAKKTREFIVELVKSLVRAKTVNYNRRDYPERGPDEMLVPGEESKAVEVLIPVFEKLGVSYKVFEKIEGRGNLIASLGQKKTGYRRILVLCHTDVVPSGGAELWGHDPFSAFERDGFLYGRGTADNKGQLAAAISAFCLLHQVQRQIQGEFMLGAIADEEVGIEQAGFEVVDGELNFASFVTDAIIPDTSGHCIEIERAEKGRVIIKVSVTGKQAHASTPWEGANAIYGFADFALLFEKHILKHSVHSLLGSPTVNLGIVKGGNAPNNVPALCEGTFDVRIVPGMTAQQVIDELHEIARQVHREDIRFAFEIVHKTEPTVVPEKASIIRTILKHMPEARTVGIGGGTFCKHLIGKGIDAVGWAPGGHEVVHKANEHISIQEMVDFAGLLAEVAFDLCNQKIEPHE
jgi:acetylornithine deacetylase/succinyl-diaminopimelate desuccinylase-like protein